MERLLMTSTEYFKKISFLILCSTFYFLSQHKTEIGIHNIVNFQIVFALKLKNNFEAQVWKMQKLKCHFLKIIYLFELVWTHFA